MVHASLLAVLSAGTTDACALVASSGSSRPPETDDEDVKVQRDHCLWPSFNIPPFVSGIFVSKCLYDYKQKRCLRVSGSV